MEGHISPVSSADEDETEEVIAILQEELKYDEVDINIHFHCEHCFKIKNCNVSPKIGFSCEIIHCPHNCGMRFHACKLPEHKMMCSNVRVPCLNRGYGCPHTVPRYAMARHLAQCPASVVVCGSERNRWIAGSRMREITAPPTNHMRNFNPTDLDVCIAQHDQALLNQLSGISPEDLKAATSPTNRRYPLLPLRSPLAGGGYRRVCRGEQEGRSKRSPSLATDEEDLPPGLSGSVCAKLMGRQGENKESDQQGSTAEEDYTLRMCCHFVDRKMCRFCKNEEPLPRHQMKSVWREKYDPTSETNSRWTKQQRVAKILQRGPFDTITLIRVEDSDDENPTSINSLGRPRSGYVSSSLSPCDLKVELTCENYSRHQAKPRNMITIQCLQVLRRDEYHSHYASVHCDVLGEGLEGGLLVHRCPLHYRGCGHSLLYRTAGSSSAREEVVFSPSMQAFGLRPRLQYEHPLPPDTREVSQEPAEKFTYPDSTSLIISSALVPPTASYYCTSPSPRGPSPSPRGPSSSPRGSSPYYPNPSPFSLGSTAVDGDSSPLYRNTSPLYGSSSPLPLCPPSPRLTCLPRELLLHILGFLDGFSLSQVSQTCETLADACAGLVRERGLVIQYWHKLPAAAPATDTAAASNSGTPAPAATNSKSKSAPRSRWKLGEPVWVFSSSMGAVATWSVDDKAPSLSDHLTNCPYYNRNVQTEKFSYGKLPRALKNSAV